MFGLFRKSSASSNNGKSKEEILNDGLSLAMAWGNDWLKPIQERLRTKFPSLSESELNAYNATCQTAMKFGHNTVYEMATKNGKDTKQEEFAAVMEARYPWINKRNVSALFSQGMYYAWKDGGLG